jgi:uncharacterized protein (DUF1330 family)
VIARETLGALRESHWTEDLMNMKYAAAISMFVGLVIGAIGTQTLRAEANLPVYFVAENEVTNKDGYIKEYAPLARKSIKEHGGRVIAAGSATPFAGAPPKSRVVILVWDSMDQLQKWFDSPQYKNARQIGEKYAKFRNYAIPSLKR